MTSIEETACLYRAAGYDKQGRAVIVFIGKWFRQSQVSRYIFFPRFVELQIGKMGSGRNFYEFLGFFSFPLLIYRDGLRGGPVY